MFKDESSYTFKEMGSAFGDLISSKSPPLTLGIMTEQGRSDSFQLSVKAHLCRNSLNTRKLRPNVFPFLWRLLFFLPSRSYQNFKSKDYIFIRLTTADYLGTDKVYAGVLNTISLALERNFGEMKLRVFRAWNHDGMKDLRPYTAKSIGTSILSISRSSKWRFQSIWFFFWLTTAVSMVTATVLLWVLDLNPNFPKTESQSNEFQFISIAMSSIVSIGFVSKLPAIFTGVFHLAISQSQQIKKWAKGADLKDSLGFMWLIKMELLYINSFLRFMSHLLDRDINAVLLVDDVSKLGREPMMKLFEVSSLLSSSRGSRFIQILTMNPLLVAGIVKKQMGYEMTTVTMGPRSFLKSYVDLFFHVQSLNMQMKKWYLELKAGEGYMRNISDGLDTCSVEDDCEKHANMSLMDEEKAGEDSTITSFSDHDRLRMVTAHSLLHKSICSYLSQWNIMLGFITGNQDSIRRIVLGSELTMRLLQSHVASGLSNPISDTSLESVIRWTVLVEQWPYRVSWMFLLIRENRERNAVYPDRINLIEETDLLEDILDKGKSIMKAVETSETFSSYTNLLYLDEDPDVFLMFLRQFNFKVEDLSLSTAVRINLDRSIEKILSRCLQEAEELQSNFEHSFGFP